MARHIDNWGVFNQVRVRGMVGLSGVMTRPVVSVDVEAKTITVRGGEVFTLGEPSPANEVPLDQFAESIAKLRRPDVVE